MAEETTDAPAAEERPAGAGWFQSRTGTVMYADGAGQRAALTGQGWTEIDEEQAKTAVAAGVNLTIGGDTAGTFDEDAVTRAVRDETHTPRKRTAKPKE